MLYVNSTAPSFTYTVSDGRFVDEAADTSSITRLVNGNSRPSWVATTTTPLAPFALRARADELQHLLHLDEIEVRSWFVGEDQGGSGVDRASSGTALLLSAAQVTHAVLLFVLRD
ncbi:hypothetical protein [Mycobacterium lepromatosis]|uniref:hypothetical protein n=1 Tax=Mycobacterium lepromatosis TaxID=480418 RepID=UPI0005F770AD|nr:hypothetical protein [Mycobacterium lepromatosis]